jgi:hypothetical protein
VDEDKRARATRIASSPEPARIDVHWLTSEAIGAWNKLDTLEAEVVRLRAENARLLRGLTRDDTDLPPPGWPDPPPVI